LAPRKISGSPALSMTKALLRFGTSESHLEKEDCRDGQKAQALPSAFFQVGTAHNHKKADTP
jgi:hypothetical protein